MFLLLRLLIVASCFISSVYGIDVLRRHFIPSYFKVAVCGMFASFLTRLFFFLLSLSSGNDASFSVGVFGQAAIYLFYVTANQAYIPPEEEERDQQELCLSGLMVAGIPCALFLISAAISGSFGAYVGETVYIASMGPSVYFAFKNIQNKYHNPFRKALTGFNSCIIVLVYVNACMELCNVLGIGSGNIVIPVILTILSVFVLLLMLPVLERGLKQWET